MTISEIEELEGLEQAATGAPWEFYCNSPASGQSRACVSIPWNGPHFWRKSDGSIEWHDCPRMIAWQSKTYEYGCCTNPDCEGCGECESIQPPELGPILNKEAANLRLLSAARNALPRLIADWRRMREALERIRDKPPGTAMIDSKARCGEARVWFGYQLEARNVLTETGGDHEHP